MMAIVDKMTETLVLDALTRLNQIGAAVAKLGDNTQESVKPTLELIAQSAAELITGASAVIYTYDEEHSQFEATSRVSSERSGPGNLDDFPRIDGLGMRAINRGSRVLSYEEDGISIHPAKVATGAKAMVCFPLVSAKENQGVLYVYLHEERRFSDMELLMLENFVSLTALALSLAKHISLAQQEQNRKERELRRLRRAGMLLSSRSSLKEILDTILSMALEITDATYGIFRLVDSTGSYLATQSIAGIGLEKPATEVLPLDDHSIMGVVGLNREPVVIPDLREEPWSSIYYPFDREMEMRSEVAVPLVGASGRLEGVLNLESPLVNAFDRQDRYLLQILATQAVTAIQEARLLAVIQEAAELLSAQPAHDVYQALVERSCDLLNNPFSAIWLTDGEKVSLQAAHSESATLSPDIYNRSIPKGLALLLEKTLSGHESVSVEHILMDPMGNLDWDPTLEGGTGMLAPLIPGENEKAAGVLGVFAFKDNQRDFTIADWDKKVLEILARYAGLAMQNARRMDDLRLAHEHQITNEAFAAVGDVAANLLHRLNNKIGVVPVRVEGIEDKCAGALAADPYLATNLQEIRRSAEEAMQVVHDNLFLLHPIQLIPVTVRLAVDEALRHTKLPGGVRVKLRGLTGLPPVQAGQKRLPLVFSNLLENASDAMGGKGVIIIEGSQRESWVEVAVSDSGPGIPPELHEKIFEFNYSSRSAHPGKLGFGLWWVKSLVTRFGGGVSVQSDGKHGTTFRLRLPVSHTEEER